ncbi:MAG TPA: hypothetical protein GXZ53_04810 [Firmicutes bacterium]|nr:hypothetical protein [Bacillota bacterium]
MKLKLKPFFLGPRIIKTGVAATLSVFLSRFLPYSLPLLAGTAAVICIQPSITVGVQKGLERAKTTIVAGLFGLAFYYFFGANLLVMGLAVIALIVIFHKLGWEEGIVLASLTVIAIMSDDSGDPFLYILGRVTSTLIGIAVATLTNIVVVRPRHEPVFRRELKELTNIFPELYVKAVEAFAESNSDLAAEVLQVLQKHAKDLKNLNVELDYLKAGTESRYGIYLEGVDLQALVLYERSMQFLDVVTAKIRDIAEVAVMRRQHKDRMLQQENIKKRSVEFAKLLEAVQEMAEKLARLHKNVFLLVAEKEDSLLPDIGRQADEIKHLKEEVREKLRYWQVEHILDLDIFSLMTTHRIVFDLEEIASALMKLTAASIAPKDNGRKNKEDRSPAGIT